jgi:hypothetical protein
MWTRVSSRAAAHVVDLELNDGAADVRFDFAFGFHDNWEAHAA